MLRKKHSRNANSKRNRTSVQEEIINAKLRDFDELADSLNTSLETHFNDAIAEITRLFRKTKARIPKRVLNMRLSDLQILGISSFGELDTLNADKGGTMSFVDTSQYLQILPIGENESTNKKYSKADEGYLTEDSTIRGTSIDSLTSSKSIPRGPLASALRNRRRSKSVSSHTTPMKGQSSILFGIKSKRTAVGDTDRLSRSKLRTPVVGNRPQAVSADRGMSLITPKVQPGTPMAILRHPRLGESIYSVTGSPVITSAMVEETANVNIPLANGVLSIRPTEMDTVDTCFLQRIDSDTLEHLKMLQSNLTKIMQIAEQHNFQRM